MPRPLLSQVGDEAEMRNWREVETAFRDLGPAADAALTGYVNLVAGDNEVSLPRGVVNPRGRITVYQNAASTLLDVGLRNGRWVVNASAATRARFLFF